MDEKTGKVTLYADKKDITPEEFSSLASEIARKTVITLIQSSETQTTKNPLIKNLQSGNHLLFKLIFWGYNALFFLMVWLFLLNIFLNLEFRSQFQLYLENLEIYRRIVPFLLILTPFAIIYYAIKSKIAQDAHTLKRLFFILEVPLVTFFIIASNSATVLAASTTFFIFMGIVTLFVVYLNAETFTNVSLNRKITLLLLRQTSLLSMSYLVLLYLFLLPIVMEGVFLFLGIDAYSFRLSYYDNYAYELILFYLLTMLKIGLAFIFISFLVSPFYLIYYLVTLTVSTSRSVADAIGKKLTLLRHLTGFAIFLGLFVLASYQSPENKYLDLLGELKRSTTYEEKAEIVDKLQDKESAVKEAIEEVEYSEDKYFFSKDDTYISAIYQRSLKFSEPMANAVQKTFLTLAYPFVNQKSSLNQGALINQYEYIFGHPYFKEFESKPLTHQPVQLVSRSVTADTDKNNILATITVEEEYQNKDYTSYEVVYEFSLPDNAVITDLRLGPDLEYEGLVAPRGAASKTYQQELRRRQDPALLEQTGPRQYRLRVFPIPGRNDQTLQGRNQRVRFSYVTGITPKGYSLPKYTKISNLTINDTTYLKAVLNGDVLLYRPDDEYLTHSSLTGLDFCDLPLKDMTYSAAASSVMLTPYHEIDQVKSFYNCNSTSGISALSGLYQTKIAILYDVSHANKDNLFWSQLNNLTRNKEDFYSKNSIDLYAFNDSVSRSIEVNPTLVQNPKLTYFGSSNLSRALKSLKKQYEMVIVVTSSDSAAFTTETETITPGVPLYMIHSDDKPPAYSSQLTYAVIQSGGAVVPSFEAAVSHYLVSKTLINDARNYVQFSPYWTVEMTGVSKDIPIVSKLAGFEASSSARVKDPLAQIGSKAYIMMSMRRFWGKFDNQLALLDTYQSYAQNAHIVTPFSSLLALVDQRQLNELKANIKDYDRYNYVPKTESISRRLSIPDPISVMSDPEAGTIFNGLNPLLNTMDLSNGMPSSTMLGQGKITGYSGRRGMGFSMTNSIIVFAIVNIALVGISLLVFMLRRVKNLIDKRKTKLHLK